MVVWLFAVLLVPWAAVDGFVRPPLTPLQPQMQPTSRLDGFHRISRLRGRRCVAAMSGEPVGLLDGQFVHGDGKGGYELVVNGQRLAIKPSFHSHIKFCIEPDKSSVGTDKGQENKEGDQLPAPAPTPAARPAADEGTADSKDNDTTDDGFVQHLSGALHKVVRQGSGRVPTANDTVKFDEIGWFDDFHGQEKAFDDRGFEWRVSDLADWWREAILSMREGEVRQIIRPARYSVRYLQLRLIGIINDASAVGTDKGQENKEGDQPPPPSPTPAAGPAADEGAADSSDNTADDGSVQRPSGAPHKVVQQDSGRVPTADQAVSVGVTNGNDATLRRQEVSSPTTASGQGGGDVFAQSSLGVFYQVVRQGSGPKPTRKQRVKIDYIEWTDDFDGQDKRWDRRGWEYPVYAERNECIHEALTDMRVGEVRRIVVPAGLSITGKEGFVEMRLLDIWTPVGFRQMPSGVYFQVVQPGSGPKPTGDQRVKYDFIQWADDFDGDPVHEKRGEVDCPSDCDEWEEEMWTDMRVGEVRRIVTPAGLINKWTEDFIELRLLDILPLRYFFARTPIGPERPPSPPAAAATTASNNDSSHEGFTLYPSGTYHQVVKEGSGPKPTHDQWVKYDVIGWHDDFDLQEKEFEEGRWELRVSECTEWVQEVVTDMRVGEVRRVVVPARLSVTGKERYIEYRLVDIMNSVGPDWRPPPPAAAPTAPKNDSSHEGAADSKGDDTTDDGFVQRPSGALHKVVRQGSGRVPTLHERVRYDEIGWRDGFDGQEKAFDDRGLEWRVSGGPMSE
ncbi:unnamed protein product [Vitrella brassicaformis CCMP3155]|uniref:peptidylprolyl isomerase n=1 Tax=Vitrella brassicaformis (strain CCMP3155) TaxID=1169540 RepID=A0A0G4GQ40_VITBC|nr:unnamed protein product [Vitrella brassicaformis CCMP3155]|eukprot:CEM32327.1 unnamed protein product [Vitrella brassicaformis CCMP3155]